MIVCFVLCVTGRRHTPDSGIPKTSSSEGTSLSQDNAPSSSQYNAPSLSQYNAPSLSQDNAPSSSQVNAPSSSQDNAPSSSQDNAPSLREYTLFKTCDHRKAFPPPFLPCSSDAFISTSDLNDSLSAPIQNDNPTFNRAVGAERNRSLSKGADSISQQFKSTYNQAQHFDSRRLYNRAANTKQEWNNPTASVLHSLTGPTLPAASSQAGDNAATPFVSVELADPPPGNVLARYNISYYRKQGGGPSEEEGKFNEPHSICCLKDGTLVVADTSNSRIQLFRNQKHGLHHFFSFDTGRNSYPIGVAANPQGNLVILLRKPEPRVRITTKTGQFMNEFGVDQLATPKCLAVDHEGKILVLESKVS